MAGELVLGPVVFQEFEVPEFVALGGKQRVAVHLLPGGGRVVDVMGADEGPLVWSGVFSGPLAGDRARVVERLWRDGTVVPLSWQGWRYTVVIERFEAHSANPAWIPYRLRACVVAVGDLVAAEDVPVPGTVAEAVALGAGADLAGQIAGAAAGLAADDVRTAIGAAGVLARLVTARAYLSGAGGEAG